MSQLKMIACIKLGCIVQSDLVFFVTDFRRVKYGERHCLPGPREIVIDRPFLFAIVDETQGGLPLFAGKIMDPTGD
jgi:hypothetical protein